MFQAIKVSYHGPTDHKGSRFIARAFGGSATIAIDHSLDNERNAEQAAFALAKKMHWIETLADFRREYVIGGFNNDYYFVSKKGGSLRHIHRIEFEVQGLYFGKWEAVTTCDTMKEARQALKDYNDNEKEHAHRIKRVHAS